LYGYENWWLTLTEKNRLRLFDNRALRKVLGPQEEEEETAGGWMK
jgi:hypothetical protein